MITTRFAIPADAVGILRLYQMAASELFQDRSFLDLAELERGLGAASEQIWIIAEDDADDSRGARPILGILKALVEPATQIARLERTYHRPGANGDEVFDALLRAFTAHVRERTSQIDLVYCTTHNFTLAQHAHTLEHGFILLGVFPHAPSADDFYVGGLSVLFADPTWRTRRRLGFTLHPAIAPWFEVVRDACALAPLLHQELSGPPSIADDFDPELEMISAPAYVARKFQKMCESRVLPQHFYPFHSPNCMMTDAEQTVEVYLHQSSHFATIIAERALRALDPAKLYGRVIALLRAARIGYVEVLVDAADRAGIEAALTAGFSPYAYFPSFKAHGGTRRDFVVFGLAHENRMRIPPHLPVPYQRFLDLYLTRQAASLQRIDE